MTLALPFIRMPALPDNIAENQKLKIGAKKGGKVSFAALFNGFGWLRR